MCRRYHDARSMILDGCLTGYYLGDLHATTDTGSTSLGELTATSLDVSVVNQHGLPVLTGKATTITAIVGIAAPPIFRRPRPPRTRRRSHHPSCGGRLGVP